MAKVTTPASAIQEEKGRLTIPAVQKAVRKKITCLSAQIVTEVFYLEGWQGMCMGQREFGVAILNQKHQQKCGMLFNGSRQPKCTTSEHLLSQLASDTRTLCQ